MNETMLTFVSVLLLAAVSTQAAPQFQPADAAQQSNVPLVTILSQTDSIGADGSFNNSFEASNGIKQQNTGFLKKALVPQTREDGTETGEKVEGDVLVQTGSYSFTGDDGVVYTITYIADENGFQPQGEHIPTPPAIPAQILDSLKLSAQEASQYSAAEASYSRQNESEPDSEVDIPVLQKNTDDDLEQSVSQGTDASVLEE
ncbi:Cuticle protein 3 [Pseudolycoriella hygida]|uniref:Cuticle protein 3 n=1 Tax=Pseudolycoriella hygida TaxID=35572 RepID=A0A9Q0S3U7_9DIPT|nr:Cuticle protein 3 [Pseudolycoriella hygida]